MNALVEYRHGVDAPVTATHIAVSRPDESSVRMPVNLHQENENAILAYLQENC